MAEDRDRKNEDIENPEAGRSSDTGIIGREEEGNDEFEDVDEEDEDDSEDLDEDVDEA